MAKKMTAEEKAAREQVKKLYLSLEEAKSNPPSGELTKWVVYPVLSPEGKTYFVWAPGREAALRNVVKLLGWQVGKTEEQPPTKERVAAQLSRLSDEDRAILIAQFVTPTETPKKRSKPA